MFQDHFYRRAEIDFLVKDIVQTNNVKCNLDLIRQSVHITDGKSVLSYFVKLIEITAVHFCCPLLKVPRVALIAGVEAVYVYRMDLKGLSQLMVSGVDGRHFQTVCLHVDLVSVFVSVNVMLHHQESDFK